MKENLQEAKSPVTKAFLGSRILNIPFWALFHALPVILYKEFHISPWLLTLMTALKPASALFATYWSCLLFRSKEKMVFNLAITNILRFLPFIFFFWAKTPFMLIFGFCVYMALSRGATPTWTELFQHHLPKHIQSKMYAIGNAIEYVGTTLIPLFLGLLLDCEGGSWRYLFPITAFIGLCSTVFLFKLPKSESFEKPEKPNLLLPWKRSIELLKTRPNFVRYLLGFMFGGAGLMIVQPILPIYFVDELHLSYTEMLLAIAVCKGIGFSLTTPFWVSLFKRLSIYRFSALVVVTAVLFPLILFGAQWCHLFVYAAFLLYGLMQAGSELSWNMSPAVFADKENSYPYTETNILAVGLRGCIIPFLGNFLMGQGGATLVMGFAALLSFCGAIALFKKRESVYSGTS